MCIQPPNFHFLIILLVVDKTRLLVTRRLGSFPKFLRGKIDQVGWWLEALFYPLLCSSLEMQKLSTTHYPDFQDLI